MKIIMNNVNYGSAEHKLTQLLEQSCTDGKPVDLLGSKFDVLYVESSFGFNYETFGMILDFTAELSESV